MNKVNKRELELLASVCLKNDVPLKLAKELIKASEKHSYENVTPGARISEYEELINYFSKNNNNGDEA